MNLYIFRVNEIYMHSLTKNVKNYLQYHMKCPNKNNRYGMQNMFPLQFSMNRRGRLFSLMLLIALALVSTIPVKSLMDRDSYEQV